MVTVTQNKIQIRTDEKPLTYTRIELGAFSEEKAKHIKRKFKSVPGFMNFEILICPYNGQLNVVAQTTYKARKDDILGEFIGLMATLI